MLLMFGFHVFIYVSVQLQYSHLRGISKLYTPSRLPSPPSPSREGRRDTGRVRPRLVVLLQLQE